MSELVDRVGPILVFLVAITVVAEISQRAGVFEIAGYWAAHLARGRTWRLWVVVVLLSCAATTVLSLDTTAVLLTPVVIAMARQIGVAALPFALTTVWLANTASLLLPVSNLSNLLAMHDFSRWGGFAAYVSVAWAPALVAMVVTAVMIAALHGRQLRGRYTTPDAPTGHDPVLLRVSALVCVALGPVFVTGITPAIPATVAAIALLATLALRDRAGLRHIAVPWQMVIGVSALFVLVEAAGPHGLTSLLQRMTGEGTGARHLLRVAGIGALGANAVNNLPAFLALQPSVAQDAHRLMALLIGVNAGPIVTVWGSLATLLWRSRCQRAGLSIPLRRFTIESAAVAVVTVTAATLTLAVC